MTLLSDDQSVVQRIFDHIDKRTTDRSDASWREPVENYRCRQRFAAEIELVLRRYPTPFCPSAALPETGSYVARDAAGTPILAVRGSNGQVRAFRNACRHRGTQLADGSGCQKAFVCPFHGWAYGLDGRLLHVPHEDGFPGLDKTARGLAPVESKEMHGLVFVTQDEPSMSEPCLAELPELVAPSQQLFTTTEQDVAANWKIVVEGFLEGYHIRSTHRETFYPIQFDNLNVVETFGRNSRVAFPYQRINKLRDVSPAERSVDGLLTYVYHLFPNVMVATFPNNISMIVLEPLAIDRTKILTYTLTDRGDEDVDRLEAINRSRDFLLAGVAEDRAVALAIQRGLASGANQFFEFGQFEGAISHFHRALDAALGGTE
ncbi:MAG: Rieske 2Fe-2S domain-containing protein [Acidobacteria bacterium]|nr:Rieske 2Fe-2S domain-containing protein [Acidobacteriota bacterium]